MENYDIGKSSLSEKKKKLLIDDLKDEIRTEPSGSATEPTEPSTEPSTEPTEPSGSATEPTEPSTEPMLDPTIEPTEPITEPTELLSDFEFQIFKNASALIYRSNYKRYKNGRASGMLNALDIIKHTVVILEHRIYKSKESYNQMIMEIYDGKT